MILFRLVGTEFRNRLWAVLRRVGFVAAFLYLAFHIVQGGPSLISLLENREEITKIKEQVEPLRAERALLIRRLSMLSPGALDPDFLDERARTVLGWAHPDDLVFLLETPGQER